MKKLVKFLMGVIAGALFLGFVVNAVERRKEKGEIGKADSGLQEEGKTEKHQPYGIYEEYFKRPLDYMAALLALLFLWPVLGIVALTVRMKLGSPVIFTQERPGKDGKIFKLYKFRTMTDEKDENGALIPDEARLTGFGKKLRSTSLDELPELFNILKGEMSLVGPRPLMVEYLPRYNERQAKRHEVRPGLTGLAQVHGRNVISWEEKFEWDMRYVEHITFWEDLKIIIKTMLVVLKRDGISIDCPEFMGTEADK